MKRFIAKSHKDIGKTFYDAYSIGHFCFGFFGFKVILIILVMIGLPLDIAKFVSLESVVILAVLWELIENGTRLGKAVRYNKQTDTTINAVSDIFFGILGSLLSFFIF